MVQIIQASELSLHEVKERFNLQEVTDDSFFWEWRRRNQLYDVLAILKQLKGLVQGG
ncbi:MAG: hypothetical protein F6J89_27595 [Symploca sp. SIO1C4]|uniref:Uncharacterized protein n=1 Tax=Symploca sp. SIO1C4 TaxID=2607765 RepID=A0A6B3NP17_9CYAN|nr:hypothetical protein [Symploca sp. SIO1C4]